MLFFHEVKQRSNNPSDELIAIDSTPFRIAVEPRLLVTSHVLALMLALFVGQACRYCFLGNASGWEYPQKQQVPSPSPPLPFLLTDESVPTNIYTTRVFRTGAVGSTTTTSQLPRRVMQAAQENVPTHSVPLNQRKNATDSVEQFIAVPYLEVHVKNVNQVFLQSEFELAQAMINLAKRNRMTMLSYHCHSLPNPSMAGVTCIGILLRSHVWIYTWPESSDMLVYVEGTPESQLPLIRELFDPRPYKQDLTDSQPLEMSWRVRNQDLTPAKELHEVQYKDTKATTTWNETELLIRLPYLHRGVEGPRTIQ